MTDQPLVNRCFSQLDDLQATLSRRCEYLLDQRDLVTAHTPKPRPADALLIRPDGYVAWALGPNGTDGLPDALATWFGDPHPAA